MEVELIGVTSSRSHSRGSSISSNINTGSNSSSSGGNGSGSSSNVSCSSRTCSFGPENCSLVPLPFLKILQIRSLDNLYVHSAFDLVKYFPQRYLEFRFNALRFLGHT